LRARSTEAESAAAAVQSLPRPRVTATVLKQSRGAPWSLWGVRRLPPVGWRTRPHVGCKIRSDITLRPVAPIRHAWWTGSPLGGLAGGREASLGTPFAHSGVGELVERRATMRRFLYPLLAIAFVVQLPAVAEPPQLPAPRPDNRVPSLAAAIADGAPFVVQLDRGRKVLWPVQPREQHVSGERPRHPGTGPRAPGHGSVWRGRSDAAAAVALGRRVHVRRPGHPGPQRHRPPGWQTLASQVTGRN